MDGFRWGALRALSCLALVASCAGLEPDDGSTSEITDNVAITPIDPLYPQQWSYPQVRLPDAWGITLGKPAVRIAIFDSGSTAHPDLAGRFTGGLDFVDNGGPVDRGMWHHGTHVAGILGARTNTSPAIGGAGICPGCTLIPVRLATPEGALEFPRYIRALQWAAGDSNGGVRQADIVTLSMNNNLATACPSDVAAAIQHAIDRGVVVVNSAGNYTGSPHQPANCPGVISVAATQLDQSLAAYSDRGAVTLAAPGGAGRRGTGGNAGGGFGPGIGCPADSTLNLDPGNDGIVSSWAVYPIVTPAPTDYCYRYLSGTSMAAPHVSGTIGLVLSALPAGVTLTPAQITKLLTLTAQPIACTGSTCGAGLLDAYAAVAAAAQGGLHRLALTSGALTFGPTPVNSASADQVASVANRGVGPVEIRSVELTGAGASQFQISIAGCGQRCGPFTVADDATLTIPVRCQPTAINPPAASLVFHSNSDGGDLAVPLACTATAPAMTIDTASIDFGTIRRGAPAPTRPIHIANAGNATLTFQAAFAAPFSATCTSGCTCSGSTCSGSLAPGGNAALAVGFVPSGLGLYTGTLAVTSNDPFHPSVPISLRGTGAIGAGTAAPLAFGDVQLGSEATGSVVVSSTGSVPLTITALSLPTTEPSFGLAFASGPCAGLSACTVSQQVTGTFSIPVRCRPQTRGSHTSQLLITTDGSTATLTAQLTCNGVVPHLVLEAPSLAFGDVALGASASADILVGNTTANTLLDFSVSQSSDQYALSCVSGCTCADDICSGQVGATPATVRVTFAPTLPGAQSSNVTFVTSDPDATLTTLPATGAGVGPVIQRVTPADGQLDLYSTAGQPSPPGLVTIANTGNAPLHITAIPIGRNGNGVFDVSVPGGLPLTIAPGASVDLGVTCQMKALVVDTRSAVMTFTSDAARTVSVSLTCHRDSTPPIRNPPR